MKPLEIAVRIVGSQRELANILGVSPGAVSQCLTGRRPVPASWCPTIEEATDRKVLCEELRPDIKWSVLRAPTVVA